MQGPRGRFACTDCGAVFVRKEHRDRHVLAHSGVKAFRCHHCPKAFSRADTLSRHVASHVDSLTSSSLDDAKASRRCVQACLSCAQRKQRCDGARPCQRCAQKGQPCRYSHADTAAPDCNTRQSPESPVPSGAPAGWDTSMTDLDLFSSATNPLMASNVDWFGFIDFPYLFDSPSSQTGLVTADAAALDESQQLAVPHSSTTPVSVVPHDASIQYNETPAINFPWCGSDTLNEAESEYFGHTLGISESAYDVLHDFHRAQGSAAASASFPPIRLFDIFVDLFFEYFDPQFPCIHPIRLEAQGHQPPSWRLLLVVALIGSQYSDIDSIGRYRKALRELVKRAMDADAMMDPTDVDTSDVQAVFLYHVYLMFSGSARDKTLHQYRRNMLVTMCRHLCITKRRSRSDTGSRTPGPLEERWLTWLEQEERVRLVCCVHVLESIGLIFNDLPLLFSLTELVQRVPSPGKVWQCRDVYTWEAETSSPYSATTPDPFLTKLSLLQLYVDERCLENHVETSRLVRTHFLSYLGLSHTTSATDHQQTSKSSNPSSSSDESEPSTAAVTPLPSSIVRGHNPKLDILMDNFALFDNNNNNTTALTTDMTAPSMNGKEDTLPHILFILRHVPLHTLHAATGYQADTDQIQRAKESLRVFFTKGDGKDARRCMWHAARVFALLRRGSGDRDRRWMCYDMFSLCVGVCYLLCFCEGMGEGDDSYDGGGDSTPARRGMTTMDNASEDEDNMGSPRTRGDHGQSQTQQHSQRQPIQRRRQPSIIRLDQLSDRASIQAFVDGPLSASTDPTGETTTTTTLLHLTGVGILDTPDMPRRLISDVIHTFDAQIAWQGLCRGFSMAYKQMRRGQQPTPQAADAEA